MECMTTPAPCETPEPDPIILAQQCCNHLKKSVQPCGVGATAMKTACGVRRLFLSTFVLIIIILTIYYMSMPNRPNPFNQVRRISHDMVQRAQARFGRVEIEPEPESQAEPEPEPEPELELELELEPEPEE